VNLLHWLLLLTSLLVGGFALYLHLALPFLDLPTPFGPWPLSLALLAAYALGLLLSGLYALAFSLKAYGEKRGLLREIRRLQEEVNALKRARIEEIPRIPDRDEA
jgi:hypothetical protein